MGKGLIIKGADFSANALGTLEEMYEDITSVLINGFTSVGTGSGTTVPAKLYNSNYNSTSELIPKYLVLMNSVTSLYDTSVGVEWFLPTGFKLRPWAYKKTSSIASNGTVSNSVILRDSHTYIVGSNEWVSADQIYSMLGVQQSTYPCYNGNIGLIGSSEDLTLQQAITAGVRVRRIKQ
jgi:hypothetical protein